MPKAKTQTKPKKDIELTFSKQPEVDVEKLTKEITEKVTKELEREIEGRLSVAMSMINTATEQRRDRFTFTGGNDQYFAEANLDGLVFGKEEDSILTIGKNGQISTGTKSPKSFGKGSAHFKSGYSSEAIMPSVGDGSTRGVIVEGDGDDDKSFIFRAVSRMNRQGVNIFSDGSLGIGKFKKTNGETLGIYHRHDDYDALRLDIPSQAYEGTALTIDLAAAPNADAKAIKVQSGDTRSSVFEVGVNGDAFIGGTLYSNEGTYGEMLEWEDKNPKGENRNGFTVTFNSKGQIRVANEDDEIVGVVVPSASFVGNSQWNHWCNKFYKDEFGVKKLTAFDVVEWLDNETTTLTSYDRATLSKEFALPENAVVIETNAEGQELQKPLVDASFDKSQHYEGRHKRNDWAIVAIVGIVPVYKGQTVSKNWVKIKSINDDVDLMLIK